MELYNKKIRFVKLFRQGISVVKLRDEYKFAQAYEWKSKYNIYPIGDEEHLIHSVKLDDDGNFPPVEDCHIVSNREVCFDHINDIHRGGLVHLKAAQLHKQVKDGYGKSIPRWTLMLFVKTCPDCIKQKDDRKKPKAGHQPIITRGLGARLQVDLIDMQSMPDGKFRFICNSVDHGIKFAMLDAIETKECKATAYQLFTNFCLLGPPAIVQVDNGREFNGVAMDGKARKVHLTDEVRMLLVIFEIFFSYY